MPSIKVGNSNSKRRKADAGRGVSSSSLGGDLFRDLDSEGLRPVPTSLVTHSNKKRKQSDGQSATRSAPDEWPYERQDTSSFTREASGRALVRRISPRSATNSAVNADTGRQSSAAIDSTGINDAEYPDGVASRRGSLYEELVEDQRRRRDCAAVLPRSAHGRATSTSTSTSTRSLSPDHNKVVLVYPFNVESHVLDAACEDLTELGGKVIVGRSDDWDGKNIWGNSASSTPAAALAAENDAAVMSSAHHHLPVTIRRSDVNLLEPGGLLNGTLVDFFLQWIWRNEDPNSSKQVIRVDFPIVENRTWSLCVIVNPGHILNEYADEDDESPDHDFPGILFLDPLKTHRKKRVANKVRKWLNYMYEAKRLDKFCTNNFGEPFNHKTMEVFDPKIPCALDSGMCVCRYAYGIYLMRSKRLTYETCGMEDDPPYFRDLITNSDEFNFDMIDVTSMRKEMLTLIQNLSPAFLNMVRKDRIRAAKEPDIVDELSEKAENGDADASFALGIWYHEGKNGLAQDMKEAYRWFELAAMNGSVEGLALQGHFLYRGCGVRKNEVEGVMRLSEAAFKGSDCAACVLGGESYHGKRGIAKDLSRAEYWLKMAVSGSKVNHISDKDLNIARRTLRKIEDAKPVATDGTNCERKGR